MPSDEEVVLVLATLLADTNKQAVFIYNVLLLKCLAYLITIRLRDADTSLFVEEWEKEFICEINAEQ
jgi:hypothetical protein